MKGMFGSRGNVDLASTIANLRARLEASAQKNRNLWEQLEQRNQEQGQRGVPLVQPEPVPPMAPAPQPEPWVMPGIVPQVMLVVN